MLATACGNGGESTEAASTGDSTPTAAAKKSITIGWIPWDEDIVVTHLWKKILETKGYEVKLVNPDVAPLYAGLAKGDIDLFFDSWQPITHADYMEKYGDKLEDLQVWYDNAKLTLAVPDYMSDVKTIGDLKSKAGELDGKIVGIEPGAGLTRVTEKEAMPGYGLDGDFKLLKSSTAAMLAELKKATDAKKPIAVTLWRPHWAYAKFPVRDLEDPKGLMGAAEEIHAIGPKGFSTDFPEVAGWLKKFTLTDEQLGTLEDVILNTHKEGEEEKAVDEWLSANPDFITSITG
ncbi:glycine betaine ABC transporter substrate-binding protein [Sphaerimonospora thailandensis]|uniref:glycine betaine ABC transporter substrate-binding protein n=1 Tax=Sphaerimonospora thailandensis TaxID=795644 RepID=UPI001EF3A171|nr:glycine betaine ABC transporter substrate-binding protein [Sphaerimonospora thailandensis]